MAPIVSSHKKVTLVLLETTESGCTLRIGLGRDPVSTGIQRLRVSPGREFFVRDLSLRLSKSAETSENLGFPFGCVLVYRP